MPTLPIQLIFHITGRHAWDAAAVTGYYRAESLEHEGFLHCSTSEQINAVAQRFYQGQANLVLLAIAAERVQAPMRYEAPFDAPDSPERFPHIYGPLNTDAVLRVVPLPLANDGTVLVPPPAELLALAGDASSWLSEQGR